MKTLYKIITAAMLFSVTGCYPMISGRVVDAETGKPLEGAVARAEWHIIKGLPGLSYSELYAAAEAVSDNEGKFDMERPPRTPRWPSRLVVYKKGYIAWREYAVFPSYEKRKDCCRNGYPNLFRLERFVEGDYPHSYHMSYIESGITGLNSYSRLEQADEWERMLAAEEYEFYKKKRDSLKQDEKSREELWKEVLYELYIQKKENKR